MTYSSIITDYLGEGLAAARPASLSIAPTALGLYYATDTTTMSLWNGTGWVVIALIPGPGITAPFATGLTATGTTQGTALAITASVNLVTTVAAGTGIKLLSISAPTVGLEQIVLHEGNSPLKIYPNTGDQIAALGANNPLTIYHGDRVTFYCSSANLWYYSLISANEPVTAQTGTAYTIQDSDRHNLITVSNAAAVAVTLPQAGASSLFQSGWFTDIASLGAGVVTITPTTSLIDGAASLTLSQNQGIRIVSDGTNYFSVRGRSSTTGGTVTQVDTGSGLTGGPITTAGTISLATRGASTLMGNPTAAPAVPSDVTIGSGLSLSLLGVLSATGSGGTVTSVATGAGLTGGPITGAGTISLASTGAGTLFGNYTAAPAAPAAVTVGANLALTLAGVLNVTNVATLDVNGFVPFAQMQPEVENSPLVFATVGKPSGAQLLALVPAVQKTIIPANLAGCVLTVNSAGDLPTAAAKVTVDTLLSGTWTNQGTITISTLGVLTLPVFAAVTLDPATGGALRMVNQAVADATFGNFAFGIQTKKVAGP